MTLETAPEPDQRPEPVVTRFDGGEVRTYYADDDEEYIEIVVDAIDLDYGGLSMALTNYGDEVKLTIPRGDGPRWRTNREQREKWGRDRRWAFPRPRVEE